MERIVQDYTIANLSQREMSICRYVEKLTVTPYKVTENDIKILKKSWIK